MIGPGRYDAEVTELRERLKARGIVLLVFGGDRGEGFSAQLPLDLTLAIPDMLEFMARQIRADAVKEGK